MRNIIDLGIYIKNGQKFHKKQSNAPHLPSISSYSVQSLLYSFRNHSNSSGMIISQWIRQMCSTVSCWLMSYLWNTGFFNKKAIFFIKWENFERQKFVLNANSSLLLWWGNYWLWFLLLVPASISPVTRI